MLNYKKDKVMATTLNFREVSIKNEVKNNGREAKLIAELGINTYFVFPMLKICNHIVNLTAELQRSKPLRDGDILVFGRSDKFCDIIVSNCDQRVSRIHCYIRRNGDKLEVFDCSLNGTTVII